MEHKGFQQVSLPGWSQQRSKGRSGPIQVTAPNCARQMHQTRRLFYVNYHNSETEYSLMRNVSKTRERACGFLEASKQKGHLEFMGVLRKDRSGSYLKIHQHRMVLTGWEDFLTITAFQEQRTQIKFSIVTLSVL